MSQEFETSMGQSSPPSGKEPGMKERVKETARESTEVLKAKAGEIKAKTTELGAKAKEQGEAYAEHKKGETADRIDGYSDVVREASERMDQEQDPNVAHYTRVMADKLEDAAKYVRRTDFRDLRRDAESMARRNPAVFFGGMFAAGLVMARFFKASCEDSREDGQMDYTGPQAAGWEEEDLEPQAAPSPQVQPVYGSPAI